MELSVSVQLVCSCTDYHKLWDVIGDQAAVNQIKTIDDAQAASQHLLRYALNNHTTDNVTVVVIRFKNQQS
jgi:protein phosphatase PTC1